MDCFSDTSKTLNQINDNAVLRNLYMTQMCLSLAEINFLTHLDWNLLHESIERLVDSGYAIEVSKESVKSGRWYYIITFKGMWKFFGDH